MKEIPGAVFSMGTDSAAQPWERPPLPVKVAPFWIDERPVTNIEFAEFVSSNPEWGKDAVIDLFGIPYYLSYWREGSPPPELEHHPVVYVSWYAAAAYAAWVGKRLPTEAEWELALRDGNHDKRWDYPMGPTPGTGLQAEIRERLESPPGDGPRTLDVVNDVSDARRSQKYELIDMVGNVSEWVADWFSDDLGYRSRLLEKEITANSPFLEHYKGPIAGVRKVIRGGSFLYEPEITWNPFTAYHRRPLPPINTNQDCGFRCARDAPVSY
jgi:formylglycine-generating enzyme required for sulfatase activity